MPGMGGPNLHLDILMGRDETLDVADVFGGARHAWVYLQSLTALADSESGPLDVRGEMERRRRILQQ